MYARKVDSGQGLYREKLFYPRNKKAIQLTKCATKGRLFQVNFAPSCWLPTMKMSCCFWQTVFCMARVFLIVSMAEKSAAGTFRPNRPCFSMPRGTPISGNHHMEVSYNKVTPKSSYFNGFFHYKPSIIGCPSLWKPPYVVHPVSRVQSGQGTSCVQDTEIAPAAGHPVPKSPGVRCIARQIVSTAADHLRFAHQSSRKQSACSSMLQSKIH